MFIKSLKSVFAGAVLATGFAISSAGAVVVPVTDSFTNVQNGDFIPIDIVVNNGSAVNSVFSFTAGADAIQTVTISGSVPDAVLPDLVLSWSTTNDTDDIFSSQIFSDGFGIFDDMAAIGLAFAALDQFFLFVQSSNAIGNGSLDVIVSTVPLPPALLLFGSALAGIGFLSRKRKKDEPSLI